MTPRDSYTASQLDFAGLGGFNMKKLSRKASSVVFSMIFVSERQFR